MQKDTKINSSNLWIACAGVSDTVKHKQIAQSLFHDLVGKFCFAQFQYRLYIYTNIRECLLSLVLNSPSVKRQTG